MNGGLSMTLPSISEDDEEDLDEDENENEPEKIPLNSPRSTTPPSVQVPKSFLARDVASSPDQSPKCVLTNLPLNFNSNT